MTMTSVFDPVTDLDSEGGASWRGRRAVRLQPHGREIKMLRPVCQVCEDEAGGIKYLQPGWWNMCTHDPYVSFSETQSEEPVYEDLEDGSKVLMGTTVKVSTVAKPNWVSISQSAGINTGRGPERALRRGFIFPQQLRSPLWPEGIKRRCQFMECYSEDITHYPGYGWFCRDVEAAYVYASDRRKVVQINQDDITDIREKRHDQINSFISKVKAGQADPFAVERGKGSADR